VHIEQVPGRTLVVVRDGLEMARLVADRIQALLEQGAGPFRLALSGGSTPRTLYSLLARRPLPWERLHLFWGDERCVPADDPDSNYRMARETLLDQAPIPPAQVHRWRTEDGPQVAADEYHRLLAREFGPGVPVFDLVLLGMGEDGHTASLFPGTPALQVSDRWAVANYVPQVKDVWRLTLTFPVLNAARRAWFLISGAAKAEALRRVLSGEDLPSGRVRAEETVFFVDQAAYQPASSADP
jgi:6-phosphogluconolactonase